MSASGQGSSPSISERLSAIPLVTRTILGVAAGTTIASAFSASLGYYFLNCPVSVIEGFEIWRLVTAFVAPQGILGLIFGGMFFYNTGAQLESEMGSLPFGLLFVSIGFWANVLFVLATLVASFALPQMWSPFNCSGGFFVVILGLITVQTQRSTQETMSIWGLFNVPTKFYPVALVLFFSLLGGRILDNLAGVCLGYLYAKGFLLRVLPGMNKVSAWEQANSLQRFVGLPGFHPSQGSWIGADATEAGDSTTR